MLLSSIMPFDLLLLNSLQLNKLRFVSQTSQHYLISSQMNQWIGEDIEDLREDLFNKFISSVQSDIQRTHEAGSKSTSKSFIFGSKSPACCMTRSIQLRNHSDSSSFGIFNYFPGLLGSVCFFWRKSSVLCNFRMRIQNQGKRILVYDVPMKNIHFVVHQSINSLVNDIHRQKMSGSIDHQSPIQQKWIVFDIQGEPSDVAIFVSVSWAPDRLHEGFQGSDKSYISIGFKGGSMIVGSHKIILLFQFKCAFELGILNLNFNFIREVADIHVQGGREDNIEYFAMEGFSHLKSDEFFDMLIILLFQLNMVQNFAWIVESDVVLTACDLSGHGQKVHFFAIFIAVCQHSQKREYHYACQGFIARTSHKLIIILLDHLNRNSAVVNNAIMKKNKIGGQEEWEESLTPWNNEESQQRTSELGKFKIAGSNKNNKQRRNQSQPLTPKHNIPPSPNTSAIKTASPFFLLTRQIKNKMQDGENEGKKNYNLFAKTMNITFEAFKEMEAASQKVIGDSDPYLGRQTSSACSTPRPLTYRIHGTPDLAVAQSSADNSRLKTVDSLKSRCKNQMVVASYSNFFSSSFRKSKTARVICHSREQDVLQLLRANLRKEQGSRRMVKKVHRTQIKQYLLGRRCIY